MRYNVTLTLDVPDGTVADAMASAVRQALIKKGVPTRVTSVTEVSQEKYVIYTDGGYKASVNVGAWAFSIRCPDGTVEEASGAMQNTTNNRMEMMAVIKALEVAPMGEPIRIVADSEYVIKGATIWRKGWEANGWITKDGKPVSNKDLWLQLLALYDLHVADFEHVKGHSGHEGNERVDSMCTEAMSEARVQAAFGKEIPVDKV